MFELENIIHLFHNHIQFLIYEKVELQMSNLEKQKLLATQTTVQ